MRVCFLQKFPFGFPSLPSPSVASSFALALSSDGAASKDVDNAAGFCFKPHGGFQFSATFTEILKIQFVLPAHKLAHSSQHTFIQVHLNIEAHKHTCYCHCHHSCILSNTNNRIIIQFKLLLLPLNCLICQANQSLVDTDSDIINIKTNRREFKLPHQEVTATLKEGARERETRLELEFERARKSERQQERINIVQTVEVQSSAKEVVFACFKVTKGFVCHTHTHIYINIIPFDSYMFMWECLCDTTM